jgi:hypothetical protein
MSLFSRRPRVVFCLVALLAAGCGQPSAQDVLAKTASGTSAVKSASFDFRMTMSAKSGPPVGFELAGPFAAHAGGGLPVTRIAYTQLAGSKSLRVDLVSTGQDAFIGVQGKYYRMPEAQLASLRATNGGASSGFGNLRIDRWAQSPRLSDGGTVDGVRVDHLSGAVDVLAFFNDVFRVTQSFGVGGPGSLPPISGTSATQLRRAVRSATFQLDSGKDDHILRRLQVRIELAANNVSANVSQALGQLSGSHFDLDFNVSRPNQPVHVQAPANPLPSSALTAG